MLIQREKPIYQFSSHIIIFSEAQILNEADGNEIEKSLYQLSSHMINDSEAQISNQANGKIIFNK